MIWGYHCFWKHPTQFLPRPSRHVHPRCSFFSIAFKGDSLQKVEVFAEDSEQFEQRLGILEFHPFQEQLHRHIQVMNRVDFPVGCVWFGSLKNQELPAAGTCILGRLSNKASGLPTSLEWTDLAIKLTWFISRGVFSFFCSSMMNLNVFPYFPEVLVARLLFFFPESTWQVWLDPVPFPGSKSSPDWRSS